MCAMISGLFIGSNDGRPPQAYQENIVSLITHLSRTKMAEKVNKIYTCCQYDFDISLHLVYL